MLLRKKQGGASVGEYEWVKDGDAVEVPDSLARELIAAAPDEWSEAENDPAPKPRSSRSSRAVAE